MIAYSKQFSSPLALQDALPRYAEKLIKDIRRLFPCLKGEFVICGSAVAALFMCETLEKFLCRLAAGSDIDIFVDARHAKLPKSGKLCPQYGVNSDALKHIAGFVASDVLLKSFNSSCKSKQELINKMHQTNLLTWKVRRKICGKMIPFDVTFYEGDLPLQQFLQLSIPPLTVESLALDSDEKVFTRMGPQQIRSWDDSDVLRHIRKRQIALIYQIKSSKHISKRVRKYLEKGYNFCLERGKWILLQSYFPVHTSQSALEVGTRHCRDALTVGDYSRYPDHLSTLEGLSRMRTSLISSCTKINSDISGVISSYLLPKDMDDTDLYERYHQHLGRWFKLLFYCSDDIFQAAQFWAYIAENRQAGSGKQVFDQAIVEAIVDAGFERFFTFKWVQIFEKFEGVQYDKKALKVFKESTPVTVCGSFKVFRKLYSLCISDDIFRDAFRICDCIIKLSKCQNDDFDMLFGYLRQIVRGSQSGLLA